MLELISSEKTFWVQPLGVSVGKYASLLCALSLQHSRCETFLWLAHSLRKKVVLLSNCSQFHLILSVLPSSIHRWILIHVYRDFPVISLTLVLYCNAWETSGWNRTFIKPSLYFFTSIRGEMIKSNPFSVWVRHAFRLPPRYPAERECTAHSRIERLATFFILYYALCKAYTIDRRKRYEKRAPTPLIQ